MPEEAFLKFSQDEIEVDLINWLGRVNWDKLETKIINYLFKELRCEVDKDTGTRKTAGLETKYKFLQYKKNIL